MRVSELFPSQYVAAADLQGKNVTLEIKNVTVEEMRGHNQQMVKKPVLWFQRASKGLVLNATNARIIAKLYGDDTDGWAGKRVTIYPASVKAFGETVDAIRVREIIPAHKPQQPQAQQQQPVEEPAEIDDPEDYTDNPFDA